MRSSGAEKRRLTVVLACAASGNVLPALTIFKGKRKLKFKPPDDVLATVEKRGGRMLTLCYIGSRQQCSHILRVEELFL